MEIIAILAGLAFAINKTVSVIKGLTSADWNLVITQVAVWVVGFIGLTLAAEAEVTEALLVPGLTMSLGSMDWQSLALLAWVLGSSGSFAFDFKKAIDNTDSSVEPSLLSPPPAG